MSLAVENEPFHIYFQSIYITLLLIHLLLYPFKETHQDLITTMEEICRPQTINIITGCIVDQQLRLKDVLYKLPDITSSVQLFRLWSIESIFGEIRVEKSRFPGWFGGRFEGFGPCLGVSHPTHPHLGKSPKKRFLFWGAPLMDICHIVRYVALKYSN